MLVFLILCNGSVRFAQKSQPRGKFHFLEIWLFLPFVFAGFSKQFAGSPKHANLKFMQFCVSEFSCESRS